MLHKTEKKEGLINRQKDQLVNKILSTKTYKYLHRYTNKFKKHLIKSKFTIHNFYISYQILFSWYNFRSEGRIALYYHNKRTKIKTF